MDDQQWVVDDQQPTTVTADSQKLVADNGRPPMHNQ